MVIRQDLKARLQEHLELNIGDKEFLNKMCSEEVSEEHFKMALLAYFNRDESELKVCKDVLKSTQCLLKTK